MLISLKAYNFNSYHLFYFFLYFPPLVKGLKIPFSPLYRPRHQSVILKLPFKKKKCLYHFPFELININTQFTLFDEKAILEALKWVDGWMKFEYSEVRWQHASWWGSLDGTNDASHLPYTVMLTHKRNSSSKFMAVCYIYKW